MAVSYSFASLTKVLVGGGFLQLETRMDPDVALDTFSRASDVAEQQFDDLSGDLVSSLGISPAEAGPILSLHLCDTQKALQKYLDVLVEELEHAGIAGRLMPATDIEIPQLRPGAPAVTAALALELQYEEMLSAPRVYAISPNPRWWVSQERTERVVPPLVDWCLEGAGDLYFHSVIGLQITTDQALGLFLNSKTRGQSALLKKTTEDAMYMRSLYAGVGGEVILQSYEPSFGWRAQIDSMRVPLIATAADVVNAFVRINGTGARSRAGVRDQPPRTSLGKSVGGWIWRTAHLEGSYVPDAYGQQVITTSHLQRAHDLSPERWTIEDLGNDRHLVTSKSLADWFDTDYSPYQVGDDRFRDPTVPSHATIAQARADFGPAIMTSEVLEASPIPDFTGTIRR
jgi:hypothetical protein